LFEREREREEVERELPLEEEEERVLGGVELMEARLGSWAEALVFPRLGTDPDPSAEGGPKGGTPDDEEEEGAEAGGRTSPAEGGGSGDDEGGNGWGRELGICLGSGGAP